jgi:putative FmdB family regulatory protein
MPTYEYKCTNCEEVFEYFQKMTDEPLRECTVCGGELKRLISGGVGVIFKGSGFYTTDYKNSSSKSFDSADKKPEKEKKEKDGGTTAEKKTETAKN